MTHIYDQNQDIKLDSMLGEFYFADGEISLDEAEDDLVWKDILREGEWAMRPGPGGKPIPMPLKVIAGKSDSKDMVGMETLLESFEAGAFEHVTVPTSHQDKADENTGYVKKLKIEERDGKKYLRAGIQFTEPTIKEKAVRGSIANTSAGILFDYVKKETGKIFRQAIGHVALTNHPWINGMQPFGNLSEEEGDREVMPLEPKAEGLSEENLREAIKTFGPKVIDLIPKELKQTILSEGSANNTGADNDSHNEGETNMAEDKDKDGTGKTPSTDKGDSAPVELSDEQREALFTEFSEKQAEANSDKEAENVALKAKVHKMEVESRIEELKGEGYSELPGFLVEVRNLMLADNGSTELTLSEEVDGEAKEVKIEGITGVIERLLNALPKKDGKVDLGEQVNAADNHGRPDEETDLSEDEKINAAAEDLGINDPAFKKAEKKDGDS